eukprot:CAMPEP_0203923746 /NCGR_PEP_ID=MMETSP0359-20131031/63583_1 /ASSEMBLY_ACC=CAM_ASM_000338 /TAXON_ID=268821 /ORGANISM="Scrippsiella Hangoei, Strain SHTV-5" /LENGTH=38 /DNA_ID= /DNA_START= /DNA_END= /DNA_ORIENTATION=
MYMEVFSESSAPPSSNRTSAETAGGEAVGPSSGRGAAA